MSGKDGSVTFSSGQTTVNSWTLSYVGDALEVTSFDNSSGGRNYIAGITGWSGSYDCFYSTGNPVVPGTTGNITLKTTTGSTGMWAGGVIITGMDITTPTDGVVTQSYTFQGTGTLYTTG
ncbi:hypothetical protein ES703_88476 [subsurface metagenome]